MQKLDIPDRFDPAKLDRLLTIIGPAQAKSFLVQLAADLADCEAALQTSDPADWPRLRATSHNLISLAGSAGAMGLHDDARALNAAAHQADPAASADLRPGILANLAALIAHIRDLHLTTRPR
jgi:hypothetical protein